MSVHNKRKLPEPLRKLIPELTRTSPWISCVTASANLIVLLGVAIALVLPGVWICFPLLALAAVRSLRALENLGGHEGSHANWFRHNPKVNDLLANCFAAYWVFTSAEGFRITHQPHHRDFGGKNDPCLTRFAMLGLAAARQKGFRHFLIELFRKYPNYVKEYWTGYNGVRISGALRAFALHGVVMFVGGTVLSGFWIGWSVGVLLPFSVILPFFRMWAESEEHLYDGLPEVEDTFSNLSLFSRWFLHPAGDAYHLMHHVLPTVPHWRAHKAHRLFVRFDPVYRSARKIRY